MSVLTAAPARNPLFRGRAVLALLLIAAAAPAYVTAQKSAATEFPAELVNFAVTDRPPLLKGREGKWDAALRERGWILKVGDRYHLWYTGYDGTPTGIRRLGYASSTDGLDWMRWEEPLLKDHYVEDMMVIHHDGTFFMFAEGLHDRAQLLTSTDGLDWKQHGRLDVRLKNGDPLSEGPYGTPTAWLENGTWHLFYERGDAGVWLATSRDLKVWTNVQDEPVLSPGPGEEDKLMIALNQIIRHNDRYYAYFHGTGSREKPRTWTTGVAVSDDLIHWKKYAKNPILPAAGNRSSGFVLRDDDDKFRLYTMHGQVEVFFPAP